MPLRQCIFSLILLLTANFATSQNFDLTIDVKGIEEAIGKIKVTLYNKEDGFLESGKEELGLFFDVVSTKMSLKAKDLKSNKYAIVIFHDKNDDGILNLNFLGVPTEPYGFSNNIVPVFKAPSFESTQFDMEGDKTIEIDLID